MDSTDPVANADIDVAAALAALRQRWKTIAVCVVIALIAAVVYLNVVPYRFAVQMRVAPVSGGTGDGASSKLAQLGGLAAVAGVALPDTGGSGSFKLFVEAVHSRDVADILARDPDIMHGVFAREWDAQRRTWRAPGGFVHDVGGIVKPLIGVPSRRPEVPDAARLAEWMNEQIGIDQNIKSPVVTVTIMSADPTFAVRFLDRLNAATDALLRQRALLRTQDYIRYLSARLPTVTLAEQRIAIAQALGEQERLKMVASSDRPYAADVFDHPAASDRPVTPNPVKALTVALLLGLVVGIAVALIAQRRPVLQTTFEP